MDITVSGGGANQGLYHVDSASTGTLLLSEYGILIDQDQDDTSDNNYIGTIIINRVKWPANLKLPAAKMVWSLIDDAKPNNAISEKLDDYSITYAGSNAYPTKIINMLNKWRRPVYK